MSELGLIHELGDRLGRPLEEISEDRFERHNQASYAQNWDDRINQASYAQNWGDRINRVSYSLAEDGTVSGLFLAPVTSHILLDFPIHQFRHLKHLYLSRVNLASFNFLRNLTRLTTLDLSSNNISDCSFLRKLTGLTLLNLSFNNISDCSFLRKLTGLTLLNLRNNNISDCSSLGELTGLTLLNLSSNNISDCSFLRKLTGLTSLYLSFNNISDCSFLRELTGLTSLYLSSNNISDCSFLLELTGLTSLDLSSNNISDFSFLLELTGLTSLYLSSNNISDCSSLGELTGLTSLDLMSNNISDCSFLRELTGLTLLNLRNNNISDCSSLGELTGLTSLYLSSNNISDCSSLGELTGLTSLDLSSNNITDCSSLGELTGLRLLYLSSNNISDFSSLGELTGLTSLDLSSNNITDCSSLGELTGLTLLRLTNNNIKEIPQWLADGRLAIEIDHKYASNCINLYNNPIEEPPLEIVRQGNAAILSYYAQLATQGQDHLYEAKMLIVGEGEAGKTTLAHKIPEPNCALPHVDDRTRGISIRTHTFSCRKRDQSEGSEARDFHLNIWDFGGQEIYHYTHRFFLSKRSLYVLVADNRKDDTDFNYWLNIIELFASNSPLIIVLNEKGDVQRSLNRADLLSRYPDSIKEIVSVNFKTQEEPDPTKAQQRLKAIHSLIGHIEHCAQNLPHIGEAVPARWVDVRQAIEQDDRNYIYRQQFDEICQAQSITASQDIDTLLGYFHDLGILLHFAENPLLRDRVILNPTWATNAVYRIFDNDSIKAKAGRFSRQDCAAIWSDPQYRHMHDVLIELMKNFRLVYEIGDTGDLVAPQLLPSNTPTYPWDETQNSHMQLRYDAFMPKGIFWQFAVTMYRYIHNHNWVWRNGMVIRRGNTWAEVKEDLNLRRISLRFYGPSIAEFRAVIVDELDTISQSYHRLLYDKMIPCQCDECKDGNQPHFFNYTVLKRRQETGKKSTIECEISEEDVSLKLLLDGFEVQKILETLPDKKGDEPTPPPLPQDTPPTAKPQTIKIFLASSSELKEDRVQFEIFINRKNKEYIKDGIFLELVLWEDFLDAMSQTRLQDEYNKAIADCDIFVSLFYTKVGKYTKEEFLVALETFKGSDRPFIYTYFKDAPINTRNITPEIMTLINFKQKLSDLGHFYQHYADINDLKHQFGEQLVKILAEWRQNYKG
ncbi:leucine-rich repeat domain-containing protein [Oscillatoria sp. FACHB-1407]|nr:leucine-rich repeat domain-containing protein [Oscillatoria sp. FACHB-1407]